ncbi:MAG: helix-turn-helix domain-containing protein [Clostridiales bacterium]|nr:helix-turn-helix domain-containing protein [Clostridiales bacterium]
MRITKDDLTPEELKMIFSHNSSGNTSTGFDDSMKFIGTKEVASLMGCSIPVARQIMRRKDFPLIKCGKNLKVMKSEFIKWASQRRV